MADRERDGDSIADQTEDDEIAGVADDDDELDDDEDEDEDEDEEVEE